MYETNNQPSGEDELALTAEKGSTGEESRQGMTWAGRPGIAGTGWYWRDQRHKPYPFRGECTPGSFRVNKEKEEPVYNKFGPKQSYGDQGGEYLTSMQRWLCL